MNCKIISIILIAMAIKARNINKFNSLIHFLKTILFCNFAYYRFKNIRVVIIFVYVIYYMIYISKLFKLLNLFYFIYFFIANYKIFS